MSGEVSPVKTGEVWYSMYANASYLVLSDGDLGCYAQEVEQHASTGDWRPVAGEPRVWLTTKQLTHYGQLCGTADPLTLPGA